MVALVALGALFILGGLVDYLASRACRNAYEREILFFQNLDRQIIAERLSMARRWASEDCRLIADGQQPRGCPRGTPALVWREYDRLIQAAPIPVEVPEWNLNISV